MWSYDVFGCRAAPLAVAEMSREFVTMTAESWLPLSMTAADTDADPKGISSTTTVRPATCPNMVLPQCRVFAPPVRYQKQNAGGQAVKILWRRNTIASIPPSLFSC